MIEIKVSNINESISRLVVMSGHVEVLHMNIRRPIDELAYYDRIAPILAPMVRSHGSFLYVGQDRLTMTVEPVTGFMSCGGRSVVDVIREIQRDGAQEENDVWSPHNALNAVIDFQKEHDQVLTEQLAELSITNQDLLREQEAQDVEDEDKALEKEILGTPRTPKAMTPLEAARRRAAKIREEA